MNDQKPIMRVEAYRTPRFKFGDLLKSIVTLGFSNKKSTFEEAKTFVVELVSENEAIIFSETMEGTRNEVERFSVETSTEFEEMVLNKQRYANDGYVYKFDRDTFKRFDE